MRTIIRLVLLATAAMVVAVVLRVTSTVMFTGIDREGFTIHGDSRYVEMSGELAQEVILDMLHNEPDLMISSEERVYDNGDALAWKLTEDGDRVFRYRVSDTARFLSGMTFSWTVKDIGPCPLESL